MAFWHAAQRIGIAGGLGAVLLSGVLFNLALLHRGSLAWRLAGALSFFVLALGWAVLTGAVARLRKWSTKESSLLAGVSFFVIGAIDVRILSDITSLHVAFAITPFLCSIAPMGFIARKIAFPELKFFYQEPSQLTTLHLN